MGRVRQVTANNLIRKVRNDDYVPHHIHPSTTDTTHTTPATARRGSGIGRKTAGFLAAAALAGTLTACAGGGTYEVMPEAKAGTDCSEPLLDLSSTRLGYHLQQQRVATDYSSTWFHFTVADNQFDPCKPLSWVVLEGENSDVNGQQGGTGSSAAQAVVFLHYDQMITEPAPMQFHDATVERTGDEVRVTSNGIMYSFSNGKAEKLEGDMNIPEIDKERWPAPDELTPYPEQP